MFVIRARDGQLLRMRQRSAKLDPIICFEARDTAIEWMDDSNVSVEEFEIKEIVENHHDVVAQMLGVSRDEVTFTMLRPKSVQ